MAARRGVAWLDSSLSRPGDGRFSVLTAEPRWVFELRAGAWTVEGQRTAAFADSTCPPSASAPPPQADGLAVLERLLAEGRSPILPSGAEHLPFCGGAIGWLSYDLGRAFERLPPVATDDLQTPEVHFGWYDHALVWDHETGDLWAVGTAASDAPPGSVQREWLGGSNRGAESRAGQKAEVAGGLRSPAIPGTATRRATSNFSRAQYLAAVETVRSGIARGDFYQLNLVQRFTTEHCEPAPHTYLRLRACNPAPFAAYLKAGEFAVLSSSPERFIEVSPSGLIRTYPIKGTRPRGRTTAEDDRLRGELLASAKENAELLMIVDLLRNDLGRVCAPGTVAVPRRVAVESFATVHHLVAEVTGQLRRDVGLRELLRGVFPGGSITGAPKVSAMTAIEHLEPHRRGVAMGAIGYLSAHGRMDLSIAIRTIVCARGQAHVSVGAGIVWDSDPAAEYAETLAKGKALFAALGATPDTT